MDESENATATRMARQASESMAEKAQETIDEVSATHAGKAPEEVKQALNEAWSDKHGETTPPLPDDEYAEHISAGHQITVVPAEPTLPPEDS
jgi:hypothetical protein